MKPFSGLRTSRRNAPPVRRAIARLAAAVLFVVAGAANAVAQGIPIIRDAEIESLLRDYMRPILQVAGFGAGSVEVVIVNDRRFNAFVADGRHVFVNAGAILATETPNELIGVLAHETGHLAGGHLARLRDAVLRAQIISAAAILAGAAAGAASGSADAAMATTLGGLQIGERSLLAYVRSEEFAADSAALTYLEATGQSGRGMVDVFQRLADQQLFRLSGLDPFVMTHPLASDRLQQAEARARQSQYFNRTDPPELQARHDMVRAKILGFLGTPGEVARVYPLSDTSLPARYARAIVTFRTGSVTAAIEAVDALIAAQPNNPYFHELKGQILLERGLPAQAIAPLRQAIALAREPALIEVMLGHALVATDNPANLAEAVAVLTRALMAEPNAPVGHHQLATAYARLGNTAMAALATAQGHFAAGSIDLAKTFARRAIDALPVGSPSWLRAQDIIEYTPPRL